MIVFTVVGCRNLSLELIAVTTAATVAPIVCSVFRSLYAVVAATMQTQASLDFQPCWLCILIFMMSVKRHCSSQ